MCRYTGRARQPSSNRWSVLAISAKSLSKGLQVRRHGPARFLRQIFAKPFQLLYWSSPRNNPPERMCQKLQRSTLLHGRLIQWMAKAPPAFAVRNIQDIHEKFRLVGMQAPGKPVPAPQQLRCRTVETDILDYSAAQ